MMSPRRPVTSAFTLIEMLVSLAVITLALTMVGVVFSITADTASQAVALSKTQNWVRQFTAELKADLDGINPSESVLVLVGRTRPAALTQDNLDAGLYHRVLIGERPEIDDFEPQLASSVDPAEDHYSDPRADLLLFFTERPLRSQAPPLDVPGSGNNPDNAFLRDLLYGGAFTQAQVVYGHASFDRVVYGGGLPRFADDVRHLNDEIGDLSAIPANQWHLARRVMIASPSPSAGDWRPRRLEDIARCYADRDDEPGDADLDFDFDTILASFSQGSSINADPYDDFRTNQYVRQMLYVGADADQHVATVIENPPLELRSNLGVHCLPGCAWFQVEFLMPEDPRNALEYDTPDPAEATLARRYDAPRWTEIANGETYVFVPDSAANRAFVKSNYAGAASSRFAQFARRDPTQGGPKSPNDVNIRLWPYAVRVTVRVYDPQGRLSEPIVRTVVHRFE